MTDKVKFLGGATSNVRIEIQEREKYRRLVDFEGMIDVLYDRFSYGALNENFEPVYLAEEEDTFKNFPAYAPDVRCLGFVASAFEAFRNDYLERLRNTTVTFPPYINNVNPAIGYEAFSTKYNDYITYASINYSNLLKNDNRINDYHCYLSSLKELFVSRLKHFPITASGVLLSRHNSPRTTGLVLEFNKLDYNKDEQKGEMLQDPNFQCFLDYASNYGFYVDKYAPWRLYINLEHPTVRQYMRRGQINQENDLTTFSSNDIMSSIYWLKSHKDDLYYLQDFILKLYNDIINRVPHYTIVNRGQPDGLAALSTIFRTEAEMLKAEDWLELLLEVRMRELDVYNERDFAAHKRGVLECYKVYGQTAGIEMIGNISSGYIREIYEESRENYSNT